MQIRFRTLKKSELTPYIKEASEEVGVLLDTEPEGLYAVFHPDDGDNGKWREVADPKNARLFIPMIPIEDLNMIPDMPAEDYKILEIWRCGDLIGVLCCDN